jgi:hypothetical protein
VSSKHDNKAMCLEFKIGAVFASVIELCLAPLTCFVQILSAQAAWRLGLSGWNWWQPLVFMLGTTIWGAIAWRLAERLCSLKSGFTGLGRRLLQAAGFPLPRRHYLIPVIAGIAIALALPFRTAALLWLSLMILIVTYPRWGRPAVYAVETVVAILGVLILIVGFLAADPGAALDACCGVVLVLTLTAMWGLVVLRAAVSWRALIRCGFAIPTALPFIKAVDSGAQLLQMQMLTLFVAPGVQLLVALLRHRAALIGLRDLIDQQGIVKPLFGQTAEGPREDDVRDGDDYFRVAHPQFRHWSPKLTGENGYVTWVGGHDDGVLTDESVVFRATTLAPSPLALTQDPCGRALAAFVQELLPDLKLIALDPFCRAFRDSWTVRRLTRRETPVGKMPWDHPALLVVPINWSGRFIYPAGSGIHDRSGYPCRAHKVEVTLSLRPELLSAVDRVSDDPASASTEDVHLCQLLLWNARRILPGAYESLLTKLVQLFQSESVALFMEIEAEAETGNGTPICTGAREEFRRRLNTAWARALPSPLGRLINAHVADLALDTYYDLGARTRLFELRQKEHDLLFGLKHDLDEMRNCIQRYVLKGELVRDTREKTAIVDDIRGTLVERLTRAQGAIVKAASDAINLINTLQRSDDNDSSAERNAAMFGDVQDEMSTCLRKFECDVHQQFQALFEKLNHLREMSAESAYE